MRPENIQPFLHSSEIKNKQAKQNKGTGVGGGKGGIDSENKIE